MYLITHVSRPYGPLLLHFLPTIISFSLITPLPNGSASWVAFLKHSWTAFARDKGSDGMWKSCSLGTAELSLFFSFLFLPFLFNDAVFFSSLTLSLSPSLSLFSFHLSPHLYFSPCFASSYPLSSPLSLSSSPHSFPSPHSPLLIPFPLSIPFPLPIPSPPPIPFLIPSPPLIIRSPLIIYSPPLLSPPLLPSFILLLLSPFLVLLLRGGSFPVPTVVVRGSGLELVMWDLSRMQTPPIAICFPQFV